MTAPVVSASAHAAAVNALVHAYRGVPVGTPVRLGKPSSNLFRFGRAPAHVLDTSGLGGVLAVDPVARTAEVQGMTTYEDLVAATLAHGLMPLVVPQLRTITLGGAVTGLGIESSSFRHGLPHESVRELDVLTADGEIVTARPDGEHADLHSGFPNSYGTLGYALRLVIDLRPVRPYVRLTHRRYADAASCAAAITDVCQEPWDFVDGVVFARDEHVLTLGEFVDDAPRVSDYTGSEIFYRSLQRRDVDHLAVQDYLWRWDTDWFWCSRAFGVQHPAVRALWPRRWRRSDVYRRLVALDRRHRISERVRRARGMPPEEPVIQDVEIPVGRLAEFLDAFDRDVGITPVWLCPVRLREPRSAGGAVIGAAQAWPLYPMRPGELYVNAGFWSAVPAVPGRPDAHNRRVEELVAALGGHKSLYSTVHYAEDEFWAHYGGAAYSVLKQRYDPHGRLPDLYRKVST